jgi:hypothetical protein
MRAWVAVVGVAVGSGGRRPGTVGWLAGVVLGLLRWPSARVAAGGHAGVTHGGWRSRRRCWRSAAQRQGPQPGERPGELDGPWPGALQAQDDPSGVADDAGGDMPQPVAQRLGLGHRQRAVQQQPRR